MNTNERFAEAVDAEVVRVSSAEISRDVNQLRNVLAKKGSAAELTGQQAVDVHLAMKSMRKQVVQLEKEARKVRALAIATLASDENLEDSEVKKECVAAIYEAFKTEKSEANQLLFMLKKAKLAQWLVDDLIAFVQSNRSSISRLMLSLVLSNFSHHTDLERHKAVIVKLKQNPPWSFLFAEDDREPVLRCIVRSMAFRKSRSQPILQVEIDWACELFRSLRPGQRDDKVSGLVATFLDVTGVQGVMFYEELIPRVLIDDITRTRIEQWMKFGQGRIRGLLREVLRNAILNDWKRGFELSVGLGILDSQEICASVIEINSSNGRIFQAFDFLLEHPQFDYSWLDEFFNAILLISSAKKRRHPLLLHCLAKADCLIAFRPDMMFPKTMATIKAHASRYRALNETELFIVSVLSGSATLIPENITIRLEKELTRPTDIWSALSAASVLSNVRGSLESYTDLQMDINYTFVGSLQTAVKLIAELENGRSPRYSINKIISNLHMLSQTSLPWVIRPVARGLLKSLRTHTGSGILADKVAVVGCLASVGRIGVEGLNVIVEFALMMTRKRSQKVF